MKSWRPNIPEIHIAVIGANGTGKSALVVRYMTRRFISEYDSHLEDTYCKMEVIRNCEYMLWIMDTVEANKSYSRYVSWADIFLVVYDITNRESFEYAENLLKTLNQHEHAMCGRVHHIYVVGNKSDLERYRQVSKTQGSSLAAENMAEFFETNCTEDYTLVKSVFHHSIQAVVNSRMNVNMVAPSNINLHHSDSERSTVSTGPFQRRSRTKSPNGKVLEVPKEKSPTLTKKNSSGGLKLFKIFQT